jgi:hypothetical protein
VRKRNVEEKRERRREGGRDGGKENTFKILTRNKINYRWSSVTINKTKNGR